jgi:two-component system phosphate regulon response regulator PhoB
MSKILVVDDETDIADLVALHLKREGHDCDCLADGLEVMPYAIEHQPDLIVLDLMLPGIDGLQVFRKLRADSRTRSIPVIILTARTQTSDRITGLELGADDYLSKPFSPRELVLRSSAVLRRTQRVEVVSENRIGDFLLDRKNMKIYHQGNLLDLTTTEFKLLAMLMENTRIVHPRADLLREVWGYSDDVATRTLDTHIKRLREKLGDGDKHVVTVRGIGYQFVVDQPPDAP